MKLDEKTLFNVFIALLLFKIADALFLGELLENVTGNSYEKSVW